MYQVFNIFFSMIAIYDDPRNASSLWSRIGKAGDQYSLLFEEV